MNFLAKIFLALCFVFLFQGCSRDCGCSDTETGTSRVGVTTVLRDQERQKIPTSDLRDKFYKLLMIMETKYHPPLWIPRHDLARYMSATIVYYDFSLVMAKELANKREPCRIEGVRKYNTEKMQANFDYSVSPISDKSNEMIAIYTLTPVKVSTDEFLDIHIFSVAWPHLEDASLPEFETMKIAKSKHDRETFLRDFFHRIFSKLSRCVIQNRITKIVFADLGIERSIEVAKEEFAVSYVDVMNEVFLHYFNASWVGETTGIGNTHLPTGKIFQGTILEAIMETKKRDELGITLFVNSASAVALLGNGNAMENTSNGNFGRISAISVLGWGVTNPKIRYELVVPETRGYQLLNELD